MKIITITIIQFLFFTLGISQSKLRVVESEVIFENSIESVVLKKHFQLIEDSLKIIKNNWIRKLEKRIDSYSNICYGDKSYLDSLFFELKVEETAFLNLEKFIRDTLPLCYSDCKIIIKNKLIKELKANDVIVVNIEDLLYFEDSLNITNSMLTQLKERRSQVDKKELEQIIFSICETYNIRKKLRIN